jgi:hypothetical protein
MTFQPAGAACHSNKPVRARNYFTGLEAVVQVRRRRHDVARWPNNTRRRSIEDNEQFCLDDDNEPYADGSGGGNRPHDCTGSATAAVDVSDGTTGIPDACPPNRTTIAPPAGRRLRSSLSP